VRKLRFVYGYLGFRDDVHSNVAAVDYLKAAVTQSFPHKQGAVNYLQAEAMRIWRNGGRLCIIGFLERAFERGESFELKPKRSAC
jgi:hypothetical protein